jgi:hypothetical protein
MWLSPIILVVISLSFTLTNATMHKSTLRGSDFYNKLSNELQTNNLTAQDLDKGFSSILLSSVFSDLATPGWLQNLFERNIDNTANWLEGREENWVVYMPTKEIEVTVSNKIDAQTRDAITNFGGQIRECSDGETTKIQREGFDLQGDFCLPKEVKDGNQTLSQFLEVSGQNVQNSTYLNSIVRNNSLNPFSDQVKAENIFGSYANGGDILGFANRIRDGYLAVKSATPYLIALLLILLVAQVLLARLNNRKITHETRHYLFYTVVGTFSLGCLIILSFGGTILLTSTLQRFLLPSIGSEQLIYLIALEVVKFTFNLISIAVWVSLAMIFVYLTIIFFEKSTLVINTREKNNKYKQRSAIIGSDNLTLDGQFKSILNENPSILNKTPSPVQTDINNIDKSSFEGPMDFSEPENLNPNMSFNPQSTPDFSTPSNQTATSISSANVGSDFQTPPTNQNQELKSVVNPNPQPQNNVPPTNNIRGL